MTSVIILWFLSRKSYYSDWKKDAATKNVYNFFWKSWNGREFTKLVPETESRIRENHEFWNHEMWGSPVVFYVGLLLHRPTFTKEPLVFSSAFHLNLEYECIYCVFKWAYAWSHRLRSVVCFLVLKTKVWLGNKNCNFGFCNGDKNWREIYLAK